jgi:hypothetical protein
MRERKEEEATEQSGFILWFSTSQPLDQAAILIVASRHITLHSKRLDRRLVMQKLVFVLENVTVSVVSFCQTLLSLILLYY